MRCLKSSCHDDAVVVEVKEATKQGYSICRGGARFRQLHDAGKQDKARKSRGRYGKYIRHIMQSGHIRKDIRGLDRICSLVSEKAVLHRYQKTHSERMLPLTGLVGFLF